MKRGASGLSLVIGVDKPVGLSSHDVVNRCRRMFGERRVGHTGTLDPLASGVLPLLVGPATRLDQYLVGHDKRYRVQIAFGYSTTTDDAEGVLLECGLPTDALFERADAERYLESIVGCHMQMPPVYSAIKQGGRKACDEARKGNVVELVPREIEIHSAQLHGIWEMPESDDPLEEGLVVWDVELHVSKGTYIRSIARDAGHALGCPAHVRALRRLSVGSLCLGQCAGLEALEREGAKCALDPVPLLGFPVVFAHGENARALAHGGALRVDGVELFDVLHQGFEQSLSSCTSPLARTGRVPADGELVSVVSEGLLAAVYRYDAACAMLQPACVFSTGVSRGVAL